MMCEVPSAYRYATKVCNHLLVCWSYIVLAIVGCNGGDSLPKTITPLTTLQEPHRGHSIGEIRFSPDGDSVAVADRGAIKIWRTSDGARVKRVDLSPPNASGFEFISKDTLFCTRAFDECAIWDLKHETKRPVELPDRDGYITALAFRQDQRVVLVGGHDTVIMLWDAANHRLEDTIEIHGEISRDAVSRNGAVVVLDEYKSRLLRFWSTSERKEIATYNTERDHLTAIALSSDGAIGACGYHDGEVRLFEVASGRTVISTYVSERVNIIVFSPNGTLVAVASSRHNASPAKLSVADVRTGKVLAIAERKSSGRISSVDFSPNGSRLATASIRGEVCLWDLSGWLEQ